MKFSTTKILTNLQITGYKGEMDNVKYDNN